MSFLKKSFPDKETWCENNCSQCYIWLIFLSNEVRNYSFIEGKNKSMADSMQSLGDWIITNKSYKIKNKRIWNPSAFCWDSGQNLFGKKATVIYCMIGNKPDKFYFKKSRYTAWLIKQK